MLNVYGDATMTIPLQYCFRKLSCKLCTSCPPDTITATFADDTAVIAVDHDPSIASQKLQASLLDLQSWLTTWRMKANETKSVHVPSPRDEQHAPQSNSTTHQYLKRTMLNTLDCTSIAALPGVLTFLPNGHSFA
jgi:hypothetical protein